MTTLLLIYLISSYMALPICLIRFADKAKYISIGGLVSISVVIAFAPIFVFIGLVTLLGMLCNNNTILWSRK